MGQSAAWRAVVRRRRRKRQLRNMLIGHYGSPPGKLQVLSFHAAAND